MKAHIVKSMEAHTMPSMKAHNAGMAIRPAPEKISAAVRALQQEAKKQGLTPYAIAKATGLSITTVDRALAGRVSPTVATLEAIAKALGLTIEVRKG